MVDLNDRFGVPGSAFRAALEAHGPDNPAFRTGMYVPTRREVAEMPPEELYGLLVDWLWECPSQLVPNNEQIAEVKAILLARADAQDEVIGKLVAECEDFLSV